MKFKTIKCMSLVKYILIVSFIVLTTTNTITLVGKNTENTLIPKKNSLSSSVTNPKNELRDLENSIYMDNSGGEKIRGITGGSVGVGTKGTTGGSCNAHSILNPPVYYMLTSQNPLANFTIQTTTGTQVTFIDTSSNTNIDTIFVAE